LPVKMVTDTFNDGKPESAHITYQRMGRKLWGLGFDRGKTGEGASAIIWDEEKFVKIYSSYGLGKTSEMSETSDTSDQSSIQEPGVSDQSDVSDVCSCVCEEINIHGFLKTAHPAPLGSVLRFWNPSRQCRAAAMVRQGSAPSDDTVEPESGEKVNICGGCVHFLSAQLNPAQGFGRCAVERLSKRIGAYPGKTACPHFEATAGEALTLRLAQ
jgi:hypothetical protein